MADEFITVPIVYDETQLYQTAIARIQAQYPNWSPSPGSLVDMVLRVTAAMAAIGAENAANLIPDIFRYLGKLAQVPPILGQPATATVLFTVQDASGYQIDAGTPVGLKTAAMNDAIGFTTFNDLIIPNGSTSGTVGVVAIADGTEGNNLDTLIRADSLTFVTDVELIGTSSSGRDEELTSDYLNRLSRELETWTKTPITEDNFAALAPSIPGIYRAAAWANYNPADDTTDNEKYVTVCPIDINGAAVSAPIKTALQNLLVSLREVGFVCPVTDPTDNPVDVSYSAVVDQGFNIPAIEAGVQGALADLLNHATWGLPKGRPVPIWKNTKTVSLNKVIQTIQMALAGTGDSFDVRIGHHGGSLSAADLALTGAFPLPSLGTVTPTVTYS